jgi:translation initiation factor eIF-2B subunit delta
MGGAWSFVRSFFVRLQLAETQPPVSLTQSTTEDVGNIQPNAPTTTGSGIQKPSAIMAPSKDPEVTTSADTRLAEPTTNPPNFTIDSPSDDNPHEMTTQNGQLPKPKKMAQMEQTVDAAGGGEQKLSGAELKKRKQAEKAARRAKEKQEKEQAASTSSPSTTHTQAPGLTKKGSAARNDISQSQKVKADSTTPGVSSPASSKAHKHTPSTTTLQKQRTRDKDRDRDIEFQGFPNLDDPKPEEKKVPLFGHLYNMPRREQIRGAEKDVHPAIQQLGLQMSDWVLVGATCRTTAMLLAFKKVRFK